MLELQKDVIHMEIEIHIPISEGIRRRMINTIPKRNDETTQQAEESKCHDNCNYSYVVYIHQSSVLWYGLMPLLYESSTTTHHQSLRAIQYILRHHITIPNSNDDNYDNHYQSICWKSLRTNSPIISSVTTCLSSESNQYHSSELIRSFQWNTFISQRKRRQEWHSSKKNNNKKEFDCVPQYHKRIKMILWFVPPQITYMEYTFMRHLLRYEHLYIRVQSISGYISTIGGGYFLCHHFRTAILLAQYQQFLASLLNDDILYYTCFVQMAYSYIYNGQFDIAQSILRHVSYEMDQKINNRSTSATTASKYEIVQKMCTSAQLFGRRMRRYTKRSKKSLISTTTIIPIKVISEEEVIPNSYSTILDNNNINNNNNNEFISRRKKKPLVMTKAIDNYQRIRIVSDQSKPYDFKMAFSSNTT